MSQSNREPGVSDLDAVLARLEAERDDAVRRLSQWLAIPSVSTDPTYGEHIAAAARWSAERLTEAGLEADILPSRGHPVVVAHTPDDMAAAPGPRVLMYGHYDVQPAETADGWHSPPFEPDVRDGAIYARGASDDKGQVACMIEALRAWKDAAGRLPVPVTVLLEGEEEMGSINLPDFLEQHRDRLAADVAVISDTTMWEPGVPAIIYALRGLLYFDLQLDGPSRDLHSGVFGGTLANPANELVRVLGKLIDDDRRVTIPGFYDDVATVTEAERREWATLDFDAAKWLGEVAVRKETGEAGYSTLERRWARPSCDVNGLHAGYTGSGAKTVIGRNASAKVSFRLAANQDPARIADAFETWIHGQDVGGLRWTVTRHGAAHPVLIDVAGKPMHAARRAIHSVFGRDPVFVREGATIPVVSDFQRTLGVKDILMIGFGLMTDAIHAPNEHLGLDRFHAGRQTHARLLAELAAID